MEAKEFRIGNLVYVNNIVKPITLTMMFEGGLSEYCKRIPLTEEWLLKCDIVKWINPTFEIRVNKDSTSTIYAWQSGISIFICHIMYLHEFQNWYYLHFKNEELEVNLES